MADLFNQQISATYSGLLKTTSSGVLTSSLTQITDGRGNGSPLYISTAAINFYNAYSFPITDGTADQVLKTDGAGAITWQDDANSGTVTSVALSVPTGLTVTGSPITTNGTITIGGTLGVANGGTGATTLTGILLGNGTSAISSITSANDGYILTADGVGGYAFEVASGGDVNVSGTPVADQIAIWTDATTIKGDPTLTIDTNGEIILVQDGQSGTPSRGMYNIGGGNMSVATGEENTGFGKQNLNNTEGGYHNTAVGAYSLFSLTGGVYNVAIGRNSLYSLIDQSNNTAVGNSSAFNFTGANSTFIGSGSGNKRLSGNLNTAIGVNSLVGNSTVSLNTGENNTAIGFGSLNVVSSGSDNVALGKSSGSLITTGSSNVIIGSFTGTTGESPTPVYDIRTSSNNIVISDGDGNIRQTFDASGNATFSRSSANNTDGINLYNSNNQGYGSAINFKINYAGGYSASRIHGDWQTGNSGGLHFFTANTSQTLVERLTIDGTGAATFNATDSTGNRTNPFNTLTITTDNPNLPYDKFGGSILFNNRSYTHGIVSSARIRSYIHDNGNSEGGGFIFETTPTVVGALTPTLTLSYTGAATFSSSVFSLRNNLGTGTTDDADISLNVSAPSGSGKYIMFGRNSSNTAVFSISSEGVLGAGAATFSGALNGTSATFSSSVSATTGTFSGKISANTSNGIFSSFGGTSIGTTNGNYTGISLGYSENTTYTKTAIVQEQINDGAARGHLHFLVDTAYDGNNAVLGDSKMMINGTSGNVLIGTTTDAGYKLGVDGSARFVGTTLCYSNAENYTLSVKGGIGMADGTRAFYVEKYSETDTTAQKFVGFTIDNGEVASGEITANGAGQAAFGSWSDIRLKENIVDLPNQLSNILALRPVEFDYIASEGGGHQISFIAQEFETIYPDAVGEREDGMRTLTGWSKTEARLVKAIQEQQAIIEDLKARIEKLEV
jgi:hypothetical protein